MPSLRNLMNLALGYGTRAEDPTGARFRRPDAVLAYGTHPLQALDFHSAGAGTRPLLAFVHGGAWQYGDKARRLADKKAAFAHAEGWHFASFNFRLVPEVRVAEMAQDVAAGAALLVERAADLGVDPARIVLMGHSSGAHLTALVASDPALLGAYGLAPDSLAGVIAIDGAAYDPSRPSTRSRWLTRRLLDPAFSDAELAAVSPVAHLLAKDAALPPFLVLAARGGGQSAMLAAALAARGAATELHEFAAFGPVGHVRLSRRFGERGFGPTETARACCGGFLRLRPLHHLRWSPSPFPGRI
jgi:arylformamidase